jgi:mannan endo-1,4-beta-mannosidase
VKVTAGTAHINGWIVSLTFANGQRISQIWNATQTTNGATVTAHSETYNGPLNAGASTTFGFLGSWTGTNAPPALTCASI